MKIALNITGALLLILGVLIFSYQSFHYTKQEDLVKIGEMKITTEMQKEFIFPPFLGGASIVVGLIFLVIGNIKK